MLEVYVATVKNFVAREVQPCLLYPSSHNFKIWTYIFNYVFLVVLLLLGNAYFVSDGKPRA